MSEVSPESWHGEVVSALKTRYEAWDFKAHDDAANVSFTHNLVTWVSDMFPFFSDAWSEEFDGELLPDNLKPLESHTWQPRGESHLIYSSDLTVRVYKRGKHTVVQPYIEGMDEMLEAGLTFDEIAEKIMAESRTIVPGTTIEDQGVAVSLYGGLRAGLELMVGPEYIHPAVFGKAESTRTYSEYLIRNHDKQSVLARTVACLAILGAENADYCMRNDPDRLMLTDFDKRLFGHDL